MPRPLSDFVYVTVVALHAPARHSRQSAARELAMALTWNVAKKFCTYMASDLAALAQQLAAAPCVVGMNLSRAWAILRTYPEFAGFEFRQECDLTALYASPSHQAHSLVTLAQGMGWRDFLIPRSEQALIFRQGFPEVAEHFAANDLEVMRALHRKVSQHDKLELRFPNGQSLCIPIDRERHADVLLLPEHVEQDIVVTVTE